MLLYIRRVFVNWLLLLQIKLLKILDVLGSGDKQASGHMYTVLGGTFLGRVIVPATLAMQFCMSAYVVSRASSQTKMLEAAAETTSKFLKVLTFFRNDFYDVLFATSLESNA